MPFDPITQEPIIQKLWDDAGAFNVSEGMSIEQADKKFYMLVMLPYPSGRIHMGHVRNYTLGDVIARFKRMYGFKVLHPIGWDSFGLPAENAAIKNGIHPALWTRTNIADMKNQIKSLGISYDWNREIATFLPDYYKWNQWFFLKMWERGDVFRALRNVNWCEELGTVLANEQVIDGKDERTGCTVIQKPMEQYFFAITRYAEELLSGHDDLDWPESVKAMQRHWIGKSSGTILTFMLQNNDNIKVFTTRLDTIYGVNFLALSIDHPLVKRLSGVDTRLRNFCEHISSQSREDRLINDVKLGYKLKIQAIHPLTKIEIPIFVVNYVSMDYGTGAVMGVPAHDERDFVFAKKYDIPIVKVIESDDPFSKGILINSSKFNGMTSDCAAKAILSDLQGAAQPATIYKLKDWGISRQRYWGTPIPIIHCKECGIVPEAYENLPVLLPEDVTFTGKGLSPLNTSDKFLNCKCPKCGGIARRETDTMDTFVDSSWYWLRYIDPKNTNQAFSKKEVNIWNPVDLYIGGIEHATMHLVYARYFFKVMRDLDMLNSNEPFKQLICQGMVLKDGYKMSKSKGNIVDPDEVIAKYGADALRLFIIFAAPIEKEIDWTGFEGIEGATRFLKRVTRLVDDHTPGSYSIPNNDNLDPTEKNLLTKAHQTLDKITDDLNKRYQFNTVISSLMELTNAIYDLPKNTNNRLFVMQNVLEMLVLMLSPVAPHLAEQLWTNLGGNGLCMQAKWPKVDQSFFVDSETTIVVQVNGKVRGKIVVPTSYSEDDKKNAALNCVDIQQYIKDKNIVRIIIPPHGKLINIVVNK